MISDPSNHLRLFILFVIALVVLLSPVFAIGGIWYVDDQDGNDPGDCNGGSDWPSAFKTIQKAITCGIDNDEIWVRKGTYLLSSQIDVDKAVEIYGGFNGTEQEKEQRDWNNNVTEVDGQASINHCFFVTKNAVIDGFTITGGNATGNSQLSDKNGGGIHIRFGHLTVKNCSFLNNYASSLGGAIFNDSGYLSISQCSFFDNTSADWGGAICLWQWSDGAAISNCAFTRNTAVYGGAIGDGASGKYPLTSITNCDFTDNSASYGGAFNGRNNAVTITNCAFQGNSAEYGGAIRGFNYVSSSIPAVITDCYFSENHADHWGGAIYQNTQNSEAEANISRCAFYQNSANDGGGIFTYSTAFSRITIKNCTLFGNIADRKGGGLQNSFDDSANVSIINCTFSANRANSDGSGIYNTGPYSGTATDVVKISNSILWEDLSNEIGNYHNIPTVTYSNIQGGYSGVGNINADPLFIGSGDLHLTSSSPCIDAGANNIPSIPNTDFEGDQRIIDGDNDGQATVDIGADEYVPTILALPEIILLLF